MDYSQIQTILEMAATRGTAIIIRTLKDIIRDKKTIIVAVVSLFPIILGVVWSHTLSSSENISSVPVDEISSTGEVYCVVNIPDYLPDSGNYTFKGTVRNNGDTVRAVAVNITLGGERKSTGLFNLTPVSHNEEGTPFNITFSMDKFEVGYSFIMVQLYVKDSMSAAHLVMPDNIDLLHLNLTQFDPEKLFGKNSAVYSGAIAIRPLSTENIALEEKTLTVVREMNLMPLTVVYPATISPDVNNTLNCSIASPVAGARVSVAFIGMPEKNNLPVYLKFEKEITEDGNFLNFSFNLSRGFSDYGFNKEYIITYLISMQNNTFSRMGYLTMDVVPENYSKNPDYRQLVLKNNTVYSADITVPFYLVYDANNRIPINLTNELNTEADFHILAGLDLLNHAGDMKRYNFTEEFRLGPDSKRRVNLTFAFTPEQRKEIIHSNYYRGRFTFTMTVNGLKSNEVHSGDADLISMDTLIHTSEKTLSDSFNPSLHATINLPEDISTTRKTCILTGTIQNDAEIEKEFFVKVKLQGETFEGEKVRIAPHTEKEFSILIQTENLSKKFNSQIEVRVYSTMNNNSEEAHTTASVNVIDITHKERKVVENFLWVYINLFLKFIVPLVSMVFGVSLISQESERKTLSIYMTAPITRTELILYKYGGYLLATTVILTVPLIFIYFSFASVLPFHQMVYYMLLLGVCIFDQFLAIAAFGAVFTAIGAMGKRPILMGLSYLMIWEVFTGSLNIFLSQYTLYYHIKCAVLPFVERFVPDAVETMGLNDFAGNSFAMPMEVSMSVIIIATFFFLFLAIFILQNRDVD